MLTIKSIDQKSPDSDWQKYYDLLSQLRDRFDSSLDSRSWEELKQRVSSHLEISREPFLKAVISDGDKFVVWLIFIVNNHKTENQDTIIIFDFLGDRLPDNVGKLVAGQFHDWMVEYDSSHAVMMAENKRATEAVKNMGGEVLQVFNEYILYKDKINMPLVKKWLEEIPTANRNLKIRYYSEIPEALLNEFVELNTVALQDMPEEKSTGMSNVFTIERHNDRKKWRQMNNVNVCYYLLFNENDKLIGLSEAEFRQNHPSKVYQLMTGIDREYRNRNLSRWLKGAVILKVADLNPKFEYFQTMMRSVNKPIQKVNSDLGYEILREGCELKITREIFEKYINRQQ